MTVNEYVTNARINKARELLVSTEEPVYRIAEQTGLDNYTYFCRLFKHHTGLTPSEYRKNHSRVV